MNFVRRPQPDQIIIIHDNTWKKKPKSQVEITEVKSYEATYTSDADVDVGTRMHVDIV